MRIISTAFNHDGAIPPIYTCEGKDISPPISWLGEPPGTRSFALIVDDPDAPTPQPWIHWVIYGIPADVRSLPDGAKSNAPMLTNPVVARQGKNSWESGDTVGYRGPIPPPGHGTHHYHFKLFALDKKLDVPPGATKQQLLEAMKGHILAEAELVGTYERKR